MRTGKNEERKREIYKEKYIGPHSGPPAHRPTGPPPRLAVFMPVRHARSAGPKTGSLSGFASAPTRRSHGPSQ